MLSVMCSMVVVGGVLSAPREAKSWPSHALSQIATRRGGLVGRRRDCDEGQAARRRKSAHLLELLDGTLVNSTALVDQVCPIVSCCTPRSFGKVCLRPVVVDLPESTWPITTTLMCIFSLLRCILASVYAMQTSDRQGLPQSEGGMLLTP